MNEINNEYIEVIDGVTVVHKGTVYYMYDEGNALPRESLEMYDCNGNCFYSNATKKEAEEMVAKLKKEGKDAVIGPVAPARDKKTGKPIKNLMKDWVGVYLVKQKEEKGLEDVLKGTVKTIEEMAAEIGTDDDNEVKSKDVETQGRS